MNNKIFAGPIRQPVVVADPRSFMRGCLACWLEQFGGDFQPFVTANAVEAVEDARTPLPVAVILSASTGPEGRAWLMDQAAGLRDAVPTVPIVTILDDPDTVAGQDTALTLGFQSFIPMSSSLEVAVAALRLVIAGGYYYPHAVAAAPSRPVAAGGTTRPRAPARLRLTPREQAVFELLSEGLPNKAIARQLVMALSTVKIHVHNILRKLNAQNRTEVASRARIVSSPGFERSADRVEPRQVANEGP